MTASRMPWVPEGPGEASRSSIAQAITWAAHGHYVAALALAESIDATDNWGAVSAAAALRASILRQLHQHEAARTLDERALDCAVGPAESDTRIDALAGLAADAIGDSDRAWHWWREVSWRLPAASRRARVRAWWVGAEIHLAAGRPDQASALAEQALSLAPGVSRRHWVKSALVLGVARSAAAPVHGGGEAELAVRLVREAAVGAAQERLRPLLWPAAFVLATWLPGAEGQRWRRWAQEVASSIAIGLSPSLRSGWMSDPAVAALLGERR